MDEEAVQVQGCGTTPGDRDMKRSLPWLTHWWVGIKGRNLTCFHWDAALVLDASRHDDRSPPATLTEATALRQRPSSPPERGQTAEGAGSDGRESRAPPRFSQSHRRGSLVDSRRHVNVIQNRKYLFLFLIYYKIRKDFNEILQKILIMGRGTD